jgi:hypothetical protein
VVAFVDDGQADPGTGDRGAEIDPRQIIGAGDGDAQVPALLGRYDAADIGDDPGEH